MTTKLCTICNKSKLLKYFNRNPITKDGRGSQCKQCGVDQSNRRKLERKRELIRLLGGKCFNCGYNKCPIALEFHHPDNSKEFNISNSMRRTFDVVLKEAKKCILLCANCHREKHFVDYGPLLGNRRNLPMCGTSAGYRKCGPSKCNKCKEFKRTYMRILRSGGS